EPMTPYRDPQRRLESQERTIQHLIGQVGEANRSDVERFAMRRQGDIELKSVLNSLYAVVRADRLLKGKSFLEATPQDWELVLHAVRSQPTRTGRRPAPTSIRQRPHQVPAARPDGRGPASPPAR
ncbi:MAG: hypothetical protein LC623_09875, partial [Halobacteriales archaeon]|nr:hypothetical protein [Halobacteriales archaeon]